MSQAAIRRPWRHFSPQTQAARRRRRQAAALLIDILLRDGHFAADAEGAAGDF